MKTYKKIIAAILGLTLVLSMTACEDPSVAGNKPAGNPGEDVWTPPTEQSESGPGTQGSDSQPGDSQQPSAAPEAGDTAQPDLTGNITWTVDNYVLTISGTGAMESILDQNGNAPWQNESESVISIVIENGITTIAPYAFFHFDRAADISIPDSVTTIGNYAFQSASGRNGFTIPDSVTFIGENAFAGLGIHELTVPGSVKELTYHAFASCGQLTNIVILDGVTSIGSFAFGSCSKLTSVTIPASVTYIDETAFGFSNRDLIIYGYAGSAAETYAIADGRNFSAIS